MKLCSCSMYTKQWYEVDVTSVVNSLSSDYLSIRVIPSAVKGASCESLRLIFASKELNGFGPQLVVVSKIEEKSLEPPIPSSMQVPDNYDVISSESSSNSIFADGVHVQFYDCSSDAKDTPPVGEPFVIIPTDDAYINPHPKFNDKNFGNATELYVDSRSGHITLIKFDIACLASRSVTSAVLKLYTIDSSVNGGMFHISSDNRSTWDETLITYSNAPPTPASNADATESLRKVRSETWISLDITDALFNTAENVGNFVTIMIDSTSENR